MSEEIPKSEVGSPKSEKENKSLNDSLELETKLAQTANSKLPTENMEVHHHPEVEKKGLKEYLLEGLMIFLAVTMGFFAETIRENISDKAKGEEYVRSFVQDLRTDTATFSVLIAFDERKARILNNMSTCFDTIKNNSQSAWCLVPIVQNSLYNHNVSFADGTLQQLRNAGGFRLLNKRDRDSIVAYDHAVRAYQNFESTVFQQRQDIVREVFVRLINFKAQEELAPDSVKNNVKTTLLFSEDKARINEFFNDLYLYKRVIRNQGIMVKKIKTRAAGLINYFKSKYDLDK